jgi:hypothetical protein
VRQGTASALVVVVAWIASRSSARARPELTGVAAICGQYSELGARLRAVFGGEERGEGGYIYRRGVLG